MGRGPASRFYKGFFYVVKTMTCRSTTRRSKEAFVKADLALTFTQPLPSIFGLLANLADAKYEDYVGFRARVQTSGSV